MSKLVILSSLFCAVFGAEIGTVVNPVGGGFSGSPLVTPYSAYPYGVQGLSDYPYTHGAYNAVAEKTIHPSGAYSHHYQYSGPLHSSPYSSVPLEKSTFGVPTPVATPYSALYGSSFGISPTGVPSQFGYPSIYDLSRPVGFGRSLESKTQ